MFFLSFLQTGAAIFPFLRRTPALPLLFRAMGANIQSCRTTTIDTFDIFDYDLVTIKKGAKLCNAAVVSCSFVAPAGVLASVQVLMLSPVTIGEGCELGHACVVPPGKNEGGEGEHAIA